MRRALSLKRHFLWIVAATALSTVTFIYSFCQHFSLNAKTVRLSFKENQEFLRYDLEKEEPFDIDQECQLPRLHPFDFSILKYLSLPNPFKCTDRQPVLTFVDQTGVVRLNISAARFHGYDPSTLSCHFQEIIRKDDWKVQYGSKQRIALNGSRIFSDFVYVSCSNMVGFSFYTNIHLNIVPIYKYSHEHEYKNKSYNVLIIGIDSLSRLSFIRQLPKTYKYLKDNLKAFIFRGMTKVGDNTFPNLAAIFTGKSITGNELPPNKDPSETYDTWPCLWKNFSEAGYATFFAEDLPDLNVFNYHRGGFQEAPTDHYMRPFWIAMQNSRLYRLSSHLCFGSVPKHLLQIRYLKDFVSKYSKAAMPFFAFSFLVELSHDYVSQISLADDDFESLLSDLFKSGYLNRTFLLFLSDHGHRFDPLRETSMGRIEERMPFFSIVPPISLSPSHYKSLELNQRRLTSLYDVYFTLMDILSYSINNTELGSITSPRGTTLFGPVHVNRTCQSAGIPDHYCICEVEETLANSDPRSLQAAGVLVDSINALLRKPHLNECASLSLSEIRRVDLIGPSSKITKDSKRQPTKYWRDFLLEFGYAKGIVSKLRAIVKTVPGGALFEGTLQHRADDGSVSVLGDISRINKYGLQSSCINDTVLKKYCYCKWQPS